MDNQMKSYYIAYFDVLGYKAFFEDKGNDVFVFLESNIQMANDIVRKTEPDSVFSDMHFLIKSFSDNFMILIEDDGKSDGYKEVKALSYLMALFQLRFLEKYKILVRGSITKGSAYINENIVFGEGLIRAVTQEEKANFPRIIIDSEESRIEKEICNDLLEKCISKDEDDAYYVDFFDILGSSVGFDNEFSTDINDHLTNLRKNVVALVKKHGKYVRNVKDPAKIAAAEKTISKYAWLLTKFNNYCELNAPEQSIRYSLVLYYRLMRCEIEVKE